MRDVNRATGRLNSGIPQVPGPRGTGELSRAGQQLPIWPLKDDILRTIGHNQVTLLVGDTGSGKTTQVSSWTGGGDRDWKWSHSPGRVAGHFHYGRLSAWTVCIAQSENGY